MELTLNELKILRNALNKKLRTVRLQSSEYDDIKQSFNKVNAEIERIENDIKQKARDEAFKAISEIENAMIRWHLARSNDDETLEEINKILVSIGRLGWFNRNKKHNKKMEAILDEIREAAFKLEANGAKPEKIIILAPKYFIDMLRDEHEKMTGDKFNRRDRMKLYGYPIFPSFENKITVYDEDIVVDLGRFPIKIELF